MEKNPLNIKTANFEQHAIILKFPEVHTGRKLVLLHGAGIAGELTWTYVANYLTGWDEILIPDFAGMGRSRFLNSAVATEPSVKDYADQILELLTALDWTKIDLAGYSFGGSVTENLLDGRLEEAGIHCYLMFLLEPAFLSAVDAEGLKIKAERYLAISNELEQIITSGADDHDVLLQFLDHVSPKRKSNEVADKVAVKRLRGNRSGLCQALKAVSQHLLANLERFPDWQPPLPGMGFVGGNSSEGMIDRQLNLEAQSSDWFAQTLSGADHSLVFTHPKQIARLMNERLENLGLE